MLRDPESVLVVACGIALFACRGPTCPANEPQGRRYTVREVVAEAKTSPSLEGQSITVCGFVWAEDEKAGLWQEADAFESVRSCIASPSTCIERRDSVRLSLGGALAKWRGFHNDKACIKGTFHAGKSTADLDASPLELSVSCATPMP